MTQEEKQLLLIDLCERLPYQPMCEFTDTEDDFCTATAALGYSLRDFIAGKVIIKPYLRPMSSMTEEEKVEMSNAIDADFQIARDAILANNTHLTSGYNKLDWLNKNGFDYRGLIPMGLALEAKEGMYKS